MWLKTGSGAAAGQRPWLDTEDLIPIAQEAGFLFGKDISDHILSLADKEHTGSPFFADGDFTEPFCKYLYLGR
jgi:hypothetical protein